MNELILSEEQLKSMPINELKTLCIEAEINIEGKQKKSEIINLILNYGTSEIENQPTEKIDQGKPINDDQPFKNTQNSNNNIQGANFEQNYNIIEEGDTKDKTALLKFISPEATIRYIRKKLLNEVYDHKTKTSVRIDLKRPVASKEFVDGFEALILSIINPQSFISSYGEDEYITTIRMNLIDFNDKLLNSMDIDDDNYNILFNIFRNLILVGVKISYNGDFRRLLERLNAGIIEDPSTKNAQMTQQKNLWDEFIGMAGAK